MLNSCRLNAKLPNYLNESDESLNYHETSELRLRARLGVARFVLSADLRQDDQIPRPPWLTSCLRDYDTGDNTLKEVQKMKEPCGWHRK